MLVLRSSVAFALTALALATGCAVEEDRPAPAGGTGVITIQDDSPYDFVEPRGACTPGDVADCKIVLATHGDVEHCVIAEKVCGDDGSWGACGAEPVSGASGDVEDTEEDTEDAAADEASDGAGGGIPA